MATAPNCESPQPHTTPPFTPPLATGDPAHAPVPVRLQLDLRQLLTQPSDSTRSLQELLKLATHYTSSPFVGYYRVHEEECTPLAVSDPFPSPDRGCRADEFFAVCRQSVHRGHVTSRCLSPTQQLFAVAVPLVSRERIPTVLAALLTPSKSGLTAHLATLDRIAAAIIEWRLTEALDRLDWEAHTSAAATELCSQINVSKSP